ncbi:hypothetical protein B0H16DRAFT_657214 [Mycena metata]|uniref:Secreted protein n=1 Tax=Mycena metata TaxID=1033252 RepID=A0AAD7NEU9_9AGAR|nr:hypothetical protein B0H16DRAFT_657214 [Mycena metata]
MRRRCAAQRKDKAHCLFFFLLCTVRADIYEPCACISFRVRRLLPPGVWSNLLQLYLRCQNSAISGQLRPSSRHSFLPRTTSRTRSLNTYPQPKLTISASR